MKNPNYLKNIILAFVLFFVGRVLVNSFGNVGIGIVLVGVVIYYIFWWRGYQRDKSNR